MVLDSLTDYFLICTIKAIMLNTITKKPTPAIIGNFWTRAALISAPIINPKASNGFVRIRYSLLFILNDHLPKENSPSQPCVRTNYLQTSDLFSWKSLLRLATAKVLHQKCFCFLIIMAYSTRPVIFSKPLISILIISKKTH